MQETWVWSLRGEDLTCWEATNSVCYNCWACALEPVLCNKRKWKWKLLSHVQLFVISWTVAHQSPLSIEFSRQEYWNELSFPSPGDLPDPGIFYVVGRLCFLWTVHSLRKTLLTIFPPYFVLQGQAACYSRYLLTSYFCIPVPCDEKDIFFFWC